MHVQMLLLLLLLALPWSSSIDSIPILSHPNEPFRRGSDRSCSAGFKVYVYNISADLLQLAEQARRNQTFHVCQKCIYEQFALEYVLFDYFTQFCGRTHDPSQADFFYLPIIREIDYRVALQRGNRAPSKIEEALIDAIEKQNTDTWRQVFGVTDEFWRRNKGMDHILVMPAPVTNLRHQTSARGFFHYVSDS